MLDVRDKLAERALEEEALCAVCGDGFSAEPNLIVFCERCDVAVHQQCYGIPELPQGTQPCTAVFHLLYRWLHKEWPVSNLSVLSRTSTAPPWHAPSVGHL